MKNIFLIIFIVLIVGCSSSPEKLLEKGDRFVEDAKIEKALGAYQTVIEKFPNDTLAQNAKYSIAWIELDKQLEFANGLETLRDIAKHYAELEVGRAAQNDMENFARWLINKTNELRSDTTTTEALHTIEYLINNFKDDPLLAEALYLKGNIYLNDLKDHYRAVNTYQEILHKFKGTNFEPMSKFMIGYIYANVQNDYHKAKPVYSEFLQEFPEHELAPSVQFELEYLGKKVKDIGELKLRDN